MGRLWFADRGGTMDRLTHAAVRPFPIPGVVAHHAATNAAFPRERPDQAVVMRVVLVVLDPLLGAGYHD